MPYIDTGWLSLALFVGMIVQLVGFHIFYLMYLEVIEESLGDILLVEKHRKYYGDSYLGRRMREILIMLMVIAPSAYKKQERIPAWKIEKVPVFLRRAIKLNAYLMIITVTAATLLYFFRLSPGIA